VPLAVAGLCRRQRLACRFAGTERLSFAMALAGAFATCSGGCFLARASHGAAFVRHRLWQVPLPRCGDRAEGARPRPLHSPALRQPRSPLRGAFTPSAFLTDRRRFAPAQRRLSRHPCRSPWKASVVQRVGMAPSNPRCGSPIFFQPPRGGKTFEYIQTSLLQLKSAFHVFTSFKVTARREDFKVHPDRAA